jgi:hypothetical protein
VNGQVYEMPTSRLIGQMDSRCGRLRPQRCVAQSPYHSGRIASRHNPGGSSPTKYGSYAPKKETLQALGVLKNVAWDPLAFRAKEINESVDHGGKILVNQRIRLRQFGVLCCRRPKGSKLFDGVLALS